MPNPLDQLQELYTEHGKGFRYLDSKNQVLVDKELTQRITELVIPPAWQEVWICPKPNGHVLATGIDEKGRKQYIYHPRWRTIRDLIKFYRLIVFAKGLPAIRTAIEHNLHRRNLNREKVLGTMLWLLDNTYIRIGNEQYYEQNESIGLTTLTDKHIVIAGSVTTLSFTGKSGKDQQITFDDARIARILDKLKSQRGERLFRYHDGNTLHQLEPADVNQYLHDLTGTSVSAKDFRTWGGTLMAFNHLLETRKLPAADTPKLEKVIVQAADAAANVLGNTRTVARSSYIHPDLLGTYGSRDFEQYYAGAQKKRAITGLDKRETELLSFLSQLFETEFNVLQKNTATDAK
jgi:DNA topoisomerase-1